MNVKEYGKILEETELSFEGHSITEQCKSFLRGLLEKNINKRFSFDQAANHPWIILIKEKVEEISINYSSDPDKMIHELNKYIVTNEFFDENKNYINLNTFQSKEFFHNEFEKAKKNTPKNDPNFIYKNFNPIFDLNHEEENIILKENINKNYYKYCNNKDKEKNDEIYIKKNNIEINDLNKNNLINLNSNLLYETDNNNNKNNENNENIINSFNIPIGKNIKNKIAVNDLNKISESNFKEKDNIFLENLHLTNIINDNLNKNNNNNNNPLDENSKNLKENNNNNNNNINIFDINYLNNNYKMNNDMNYIEKNYINLSQIYQNDNNFNNIYMNNNSCKEEKDINNLKIPIYSNLENFKTIIINNNINKNVINQNNNYNNDNNLEVKYIHINNINDDNIGKYDNKIPNKIINLSIIQNNVNHNQENDNIDFNNHNNNYFTPSSLIEKEKKEKKEKKILGKKRIKDEMNDYNYNDKSNKLDLKIQNKLS
jgi:hypothetical protein